MIRFQSLGYFQRLPSLKLQHVYMIFSQKYYNIFKHNANQISEIKNNVSLVLIKIKKNDN